MNRYAAILVHTTSHAIQIERVLGQAGLDVKLIPTPRHLSSDCGSAVRIALADRAQCERILNESPTSIDRIEVLTE